VAAWHCRERGGRFVGDRRWRYRRRGPGGGCRGAGRRRRLAAVEFPQQALELQVSVQRGELVALDRPARERANRQRQLEIAADRRELPRQLELDKVGAQALADLALDVGRMRDERG